MYYSKEKVVLYTNNTKVNNQTGRRVYCTIPDTIATSSQGTCQGIQVFREQLVREMFAFENLMETGKTLLQHTVTDD